MGGLLKESEKKQMSFDIKNKHDDWGVYITVLEKTSTEEYRTSESCEDRYIAKFKVIGIVHTLAQVSKATVLNLSKEFIEEGYKNNIQYVVIVLLKNLGTNKVEKGDKVKIDEKTYSIDSMLQYKHEILFTLKNEDF